jgi:hypothetical protein
MSGLHRGIRPDYVTRAETWPGHCPAPFSREPGCNPLLFDRALERFIGFDPDGQTLQSLES